MVVLQVVSYDVVLGGSGGNGETVFREKKYLAVNPGPSDLEHAWGPTRRIDPEFSDTWSFP